MQRRPLVFSELNPLYGLEAQRARGAVKCQEATLSSVGNEIVTHSYLQINQFKCIEKVQNRIE